MMNPDRLRIAYTLTFATAFHCGTGVREGLLDRTVVRDGQGYLYIPGSTFKGTLREHCEHLARFYDQPGIASPHNAEAALLGLGTGQPTMIARIFGSQNRPGQLFFDDARQSDTTQYDSPERGGQGKYLRLQVTTATQVRLDRTTRTAVPGALYSSEFGTSDLTFEGIIQGWLACRSIPSLSATGQTPTYSLLLLLAGLRLVERLGGNKSTGKGRCVCQITEMEINGSKIAPQEREVWLHHLDDLADYSKPADKEDKP
jgi:CRISPR/Cas system CMR subunit Cmr4 (Cas7 group RAMP superfamily)